MNKRITQRQIAKIADVDVSTVSLSLNQHPRIPEKTRERIRAIATELGYRPDPALSSIAASRWSSRTSESGVVLGFVVDQFATAEPELKLYEEGVGLQAQTLGYRHDIFSLSEYPSVESLQRVIRARGIRGLVVGQSRNTLPLDLFTSTSVPIVHCGFLNDVPCDVVCPDLRLAVTQLIEGLLEEQGPVQCMLPIEGELSSDLLILGSALAVQARHGSDLVRIRRVNAELHAEEVRRITYDRGCPLVTINDRHAAWLSDQGFGPEAEIHRLHCLPPHPGKQGMDLRLVDTGRASVNLLELKLRHQPLAQESFRQTLRVAPQRVK